MNEDLQRVIDALATARQAPNAYNILGTMVEPSLEAMAIQTTAVHAALLAWQVYVKYTPSAYRTDGPFADMSLKELATQTMNLNATVLALLDVMVKHEQAKGNEA